MNAYSICMYSIQAIHTIICFHRSVILQGESEVRSVISLLILKAQVYGIIIAWQFKYYKPLAPLYIHHYSVYLIFITHSM